MGARRVTRRDFLRWAGIAGGTVIAAACAQKLAPAPENTAAPVASEAAPTATVGAEALATQTSIAAAQATEAAIPIQGLENVPELSMTEDELLAKMEKDKEAAVAEGKTVIEWLSAWGTILSDKTQPFFWQMKEYMEKNPKIFIQYTPSSAYTGAWNEVIMMRLASGDPPDVIYHYSSPIAYAARGACMQLDDFMAKDAKLTPDSLIPNGLAQCQWQGKTWSIPCTMSPSAVFYSAKKLQELGLPTEASQLPKTYDELRAVSAKMTKWNGDTLEFGGFMPWLDDGNNFHGQMKAFGGGIWDGAQYSINSPRNVEFLELVLKWLDDEYKGNVDLVNASAPAGGFGGLYPANAMPLGLHGATLVGTWNFAHCPPEFEYVYGKAPAATADAKHWVSCWPNMLFIPAKAKHPQEAFDFVSYSTTDGAKWWWNQWADVPAWKLFPADLPSKVHVGRVGEEKALAIAKFVREVLPDVVVQWNSPVDDFATDQLHQMMDQILHKTTDPKTAADNAQKAVQAKLQEVAAAQ